MSTRVQRGPTKGRESLDLPYGAGGRGGSWEIEPATKESSVKRDALKKKTSKRYRGTL